MIDRLLSSLGSGNPTAGESLEALSLLVSTIAGAVVIVALTAVIRGVVQTARIRRELLAVALMAIGLLVLAAGAVRHFTYEPDLRGGSIQEAQSVLGH